VVLEIYQAQFLLTLVSTQLGRVDCGRFLSFGFVSNQLLEVVSGLAQASEPFITPE
jgi:hypothetical protein